MQEADIIKLILVIYLFIFSIIKDYLKSKKLIKSFIALE